jgi:hypothetical protein
VNLNKNVFKINADKIAIVNVFISIKKPSHRMEGSFEK